MTTIARLMRRWKIWTPLAAFATLLFMVVYSGFAADIATAVYARVAPLSAAPPPYHGPTTLEERIILADVIARVKLRSVSQVSTRFDHFNSDGTYEWRSHVAALEFEFDALEYLKGSGGSTLTAIAPDVELQFETALAASTLAENLLSRYDARWDDREAIVFLRRHHAYPFTEQADHYWLGYERFFDMDFYSIASRNDRKWLPDAAASAPATGTGGGVPLGVGADTTEQRFLLEEPSSDSFGAVLGETNEADTIALSGLKELITEVEAEVAAGENSTEYTAEEYRDCVFNKYEKERKVRYTIDRYGEYYHRIISVDLASGTESGSHVHWGSLARDWVDTHGWEEPAIYRVEDWLGGRDADLFAAGYPVHVTTVRPLSAGEYRSYYDAIPFRYNICDGMPQEEKERHELVVAVTAPAGTVHEAFFDPAPVGVDSFGADALYGLLSPAQFTPEGGTTTSIDRIAWETNRAWVELSSSVSLTGHHIDFIELDGSVGLRLDFDDASSATTEDGTRVLYWGVCGQPWESGDLLMLRMSKSGDTLTGVTNDTTCDGTPIDMTSPPAITPWPCTDGVAVPNPKDNPDLLDDCQMLLDALPTLLGDDDDPILLWSDGKAMDSWRGVRIEGTPKRVTRLELAYKGLVGSLPAELGELDALTRIDLRGNRLTGSIPTELGKLTNLEYLNLMSNKLVGAIPIELGNLVGLERLFLHKNGLTGAIPAELGNLTNVERFYLRDNQLTGDIPAALGDLSQLTYVYILANNQLTGCVPAAWEDIDKSEDPADHGLSYCTAE